MASGDDDHDRRAATVAHVTQTALNLFFERGFEETTVDDIVKAAGIARRSFFRYYPSKKDLPWGDFDGLVERLRLRLESVPARVPMVVALRDAVLEFNTFPPEELPFHRARMELLLHVPALAAHSALKYASWREVIAEFVARRSGVPASDLRAQVVAWTFLSLSIAAYEQWLADDTTDLVDQLAAAFEHVQAVFATRPV